MHAIGRAPEMLKALPKDRIDLLRDKLSSLDAQSLWHPNSRLRARHGAACSHSNQ